MSREEEFLTRWHTERDTYLAWGHHISRTIAEKLADIIAPVSVGYYLKAAVEPRLKDDMKLVVKAFYRNKAYANPYDDITDKVGTRFVVLLGSHLQAVTEALESVEGWTWTRDRDYEAEQNKNPIVFDYAAVHYVVRPISEIDVAGVMVPAGTPCEVQIKTILQHAYSELTHDTIYKPQIQATPLMRRDAAKAMALLEATNDYFEKVSSQVNAAISAVQDITTRLSAVYREATGLEPSPNLLEGFLLEAYQKSTTDDYVDRTKAMLEERPYLIDRIKERVARSNPLFTQPSILLAYLEIVERGRRAIPNWPLTEDEMEPLLNDLGESRH